MYCTSQARRTPLSRHSISPLQVQAPAPEKRRKKKTALVDEFLEMFYSISQTLGVAKRRQGKIEKEAQD
jgi:hypothetical protein